MTVVFPVTPKRKCTDAVGRALKAAGKACEAADKRTCSAETADEVGIANAAASAADTVWYACKAAADACAGCTDKSGVRLCNDCSELYLIDTLTEVDGLFFCKTCIASDLLPLPIKPEKGICNLCYKACDASDLTGFYHGGCGTPDMLCDACMGQEGYYRCNTCNKFNGGDSWVDPAACCDCKDEPDKPVVVVEYVCDCCDKVWDTSDLTETTEGSLCDDCLIRGGFDYCGICEKWLESTDLAGILVSKDYCDCIDEPIPFGCEDCFTPCKSANCDNKPEQFVCGWCDKVCNKAEFTSYNHHAGWPPDALCDDCMSGEGYSRCDTCNKWIDYDGCVVETESCSCDDPADERACDGCSRACAASDLVWFDGKLLCRDCVPPLLPVPVESAKPVVPAKPLEWILLRLAVVRRLAITSKVRAGINMAYSAITPDMTYEQGDTIKWVLLETEGYARNAEEWKVAGKLQCIGATFRRVNNTLNK